MLEGYLPVDTRIIIPADELTCIQQYFVLNRVKYQHRLTKIIHTLLDFILTLSFSIPSVILNNVIDPSYKKISQMRSSI